MPDSKVAFSCDQEQTITDQTIDEDWENNKREQKELVYITISTNTRRPITRSAVSKNKKLATGIEMLLDDMVEELYKQVELTLEEVYE